MSDEAFSPMVFSEGLRSEGDHFAYATYAENSVVGGPQGYWVSAIYDGHSDTGIGIPEAEVAFYEAKSKMDPVENHKPYIIRLDVDTLGEEDTTRKSSLEEVAQRYKELIESGHSPHQIDEIEAAQFRESLRH